ncbi:MAG: PBP1A family penicillin-binding protein [Spirochaetes bacterium]|nr:PBP1A family penicillin-binding protein [Spirochaetota bacterium]
MFRKKYSGSSKPIIPVKTGKKTVINGQPFNDAARFNRNRRNRSNTGSGLGIFKIFIYIRNIYTHIPGIFVGIFAGLFITIIIIFSLLLWSDFKKVQALAEFRPNTTTKIYDKNGILISELFTQKREVVPFEKLPKELINAFIAMEDNEFYEHIGVSPTGIARAFFVNILAGGVRQGGSTITQQLSKILLTSRERSLTRKIKEAFIALMMDATYSKDEILTMYLNQIFLGHGTYGVESASQLYFGKHVKDLNLAECSLLATLPSAPNLLSPIKYPEKSMAMHRKALAQMAELGFITIEEAEKAYLNFWPDYLYYINELPPSMNTFSSRINLAPWFTEYIRRILVEKYGEETVYEKGLDVYTTLDIKKQLIAQEVMFKKLEYQTEVSGHLSFKNEDLITEKYSSIVDMFGLMFDIDPFPNKGSLQTRKINDYFKQNVLDELEALNFLYGINPVGVLCEEYKERYMQDKDFQNVEGALVSIDYKTGYIEAMVGGSRFTSDNQLNRAVQAYRQPGSSIKPLLYCAGIESGKFTPATAILDSPLLFLDNEGGDWIPENYEGGYMGLVRLRTALAKSINVVSIRIAETIGIDMVHRYYQKLLKMNDAEAQKRMRRDFSICLGSMEASPLEMATAYSIIANGGKDVIPFSIRYIKNNEGTVIENEEDRINKLLKDKDKKKTRLILNPATSQIMISLMKSVIDSGTGIYANPGRPAGGKTGTTNNYKDAWFIGFTPEITTCMWMGYDRLGMSLGAGQTGGNVVAPAWGEYMKKALASEPVKDFPVYAGLSSVNICAVSGKRPSSYCKTVISEVFVPGTEPGNSEEDICTNCTDSEFSIDPLRKTPKEDIVENQKKEIYKKIDKIDDKTNVLDDIGSDLLQ